MSDFHWDYEVFLFLAVMITLAAWLFSKFNKRETSQNKFIQFSQAAGSFFPLLLLVL